MTLLHYTEWISLDKAVAWCVIQILTSPTKKMRKKCCMSGAGCNQYSLRVALLSMQWKHGMTTTTILLCSYSFPPPTYFRSWRIWEYPTLPCSNLLLPSRFVARATLIGSSWPSKCCSIFGEFEAKCFSRQTNWHGLCQVKRGNHHAWAVARFIHEKKIVSFFCTMVL